MLSLPPFTGPGSASLPNMQPSCCQLILLRIRLSHVSLTFDQGVLRLTNGVRQSTDDSRPFALPFCQSGRRSPDRPLRFFASGNFNYPPFLPSVRHGRRPLQGVVARLCPSPDRAGMDNFNIRARLSRAAPLPTRTPPTGLPFSVCSLDAVYFSTLYPRAGRESKSRVQIWLGAAAAPLPRASFRNSANRFVRRRRRFKFSHNFMPSA